jgi:hypothetical protein
MSDKGLASRVDYVTLVQTLYPYRDSSGILGHSRAQHVFLPFGICLIPHVVTHCITMRYIVLQDMHPIIQRNLLKSFIKVGLS